MPQEWLSHDEVKAETIEAVKRIFSGENDLKKKLIYVLTSSVDTGLFDDKYICELYVQLRTRMMASSFRKDVGDNQKLLNDKTGH